MIDYIQLYTRRRGYRNLGVDTAYYGKYLTLAELLKRSDCNVTKSTLSTRLINAVNGTAAQEWDSVMMCMKTPINSNYRNTWRKIPIIEPTDYMVAPWHIGSLWRKALPMQSMPFT